MNGLRNRASTARAAFQNKDANASRAYHASVFDEPHKTNNIKRDYAKYADSIVHNGTNGVVYTSIIIAGLCKISSLTAIAGQAATGGAPDLQSAIAAIVIAITALSLVGNGIWLALVHYQKKSDYRAFYENERRREQWECENYLEGEQREMVELYQERGLSREDAESVIAIVSQHKDFFVDVMMKEELNLIPPDKSKPPHMLGLVIFLSFTLFGLIPLGPFLHANLTKAPIPLATLVYDSMCVSGVCLLVCGYLKGLFTVGSRWRAAARTLASGAVAFGSAFVVGSGLKHVELI